MINQDSDIAENIKGENSTSMQENDAVFTNFCLMTHINCGIEKSEIRIALFYIEKNQLRYDTLTDLFCSFSTAEYT